MPESTQTLLTIDELAVATKMTVRTTRYYAGLGLLPPPIRKGRVAFYTDAHRERLELIRNLQEHGFTLAAIEKYLARLTDDSSEEDVYIIKTILTSWAPGPAEVLTRDGMNAKAGRDLTDLELTQLEESHVITKVNKTEFQVGAAFDVAINVLDLDLGPETFLASSAAIRNHMQALAIELTQTLRKEVVAPYRQVIHTDAERAEFAELFPRLRQLTLHSIVTNFQRAANEVISASLTR